MTTPISNGLNFQQLLFVFEYLKDQDATASAIRSGYSDKSASQQGYALSKHPLVRDMIDKELLKRLDRVSIDADWVLEEYVRLYKNCNLSDFIKVDPDTKLPVYDFSKATREQMSGLESLSVTPGEFGVAIKTKMAAKKDLLRQIGHHVNVQAWKDNLNITGNVTLNFDKEDERA